MKSLFNAESGANFSIDADIPIEGLDWKIGVVVGPSGSGKTSIGKRIFGEDAMYDPRWPGGVPIVDAIDPGGDFNSVTAALGAVGLGDVPAWLRPFEVLSMGERFRATLARLVAEAPPRAVVDEFSSVVDRQIAKIGALAFAKSWRRTKGRVVLLSCHYDILDWVQPDWVYDTRAGRFSGRWLQPRPKIEVEIFRTDWSFWELFEPHHYLKLPKMMAAKCYVGAVGDEPVVHLAVSTVHTGFGVEARACRMVVMPEWQGAGVALRVLNEICGWNLTGDPRGRLPGRRVSTLFHTSHPGLCAALRRLPGWRQVSANLYGASKVASAKSLAKAGSLGGGHGGYGGHFRAVQGFRYVGA